MAKNPDDEKQHYVPQVVLSVYAAAAGRDKLFAFDKHTAKSFGPMAVDKLCKEGGFYNAKAPTGTVSIEKAFHVLEDQYREVSKKVIDARTLAALDAREFGALVAFTCVQYLRVPRLRTAFEQLSALIAAKAKEIAPDATNLHEFELGDNELRLRHLESIAHGAAEGTKHLSGYAWFLMETDKDAPLWISDCPVTMHNDEKSPYAGLGFAAPGVQIYFPLTPHLLLVCWHPLVAGRFIKQQHELKATLAKLKGEYLLGIGGNKAALKSVIDKAERALAPITDIVTAIKVGSTVKASADNVTHFNWLQFQWSSRFILCADASFDLAKKMLADHPQLKAGIAVAG